MTETFTARTAMIDQLSSQYRRAKGIVAGLNEEQLKASAVPSGWNPLGMLVHLRESARFWLREVMLDDHTGAGPADAGPDDDFAAGATADPAEVLKSLAAITNGALAGVAELPGNTAPAWWPTGLWGDWELHSLDEVLAHLLVETACHAGHLDLARELIDGGTWDYGRDQVQIL